MYTFRFNPVFEQWVLLGSPILAAASVSERQLLDVGRQKDFVAASYPRQPFVLDPEEKVKKMASSDRLYQDNPPVGEYELMLYGGNSHFFSWSPQIWESWISLLQRRIVQAHHNPHLHFAKCALHTEALHSIKSYQRVGDLMFTSHPIAGTHPLLTPELAQKMFAKESIYTVIDHKLGRVHIPSAPLHAKEWWYVPTRYKKGIEHITAEEKKHLAATLSAVMKAVHAEFPEDQWVMELHTHLVSFTEEGTWWIQVYQKTADNIFLPIKPLPEGFAHRLHLVLGNVK